MELQGPKIQVWLSCRAYGWQKISHPDVQKELMGKHIWDHFKVWELGVKSSFTVCSRCYWGTWAGLESNPDFNRVLVETQKS